MDKVIDFILCREPVLFLLQKDTVCSQDKKITHTGDKASLDRCG